MNKFPLRKFFKKVNLRRKKIALTKGKYVFLKKMKNSLCSLNALINALKLRSLS